MSVEGSPAFGFFILTGTATAGEEVLVPSLLKAPVLDLILHGTNAVGAWCWPRNCHFLLAGCRGLQVCGPLLRWIGLNPTQTV